MNLLPVKRTDGVDFNCSIVVAMNQAMFTF